MLEEQFSVPPDFARHVAPALVRLEYLYPTVAWRFDPSQSTVFAATEEFPVPVAQLKQELFFQLYRERTTSETNDIRRWLYRHE